MDELNKTKDVIMNAIKASELDIDKIVLDGVSMRIGGKILNFTVSQSTVADDIIQEIKNEMISKHKNNLDALGKYVDKKMVEALNTVESMKSEYARKEKMLVDKISSSNIMPQITFDQATRGLSVIPVRNGIGWIVRRTYWPKFVDTNVIDSKFQTKMITNVAIYIETEGEKIRNISIKKLIGFDDFDHYHRGCWGNWKWQGYKCKSAEDMLSMADDAMAVLERVNTMSIANRNPRGLPKLETLLKHTVRRSEIVDITTGSVGRNLERTVSVVEDDENVWRTNA